MTAPGFWENPETAQTTLQENKLAQQRLEMWRSLLREYEDFQVMVELCVEEEDASVLPELQSLLAQLEQHIEDIEFQQMLSGEHDRNNAILSINAGAGGTEAQDWRICCCARLTLSEEHDFLGKPRLLIFLSIRRRWLCRNRPAERTAFIIERNRSPMKQPEFCPLIRMQRCIRRLHQYCYSEARRY